MQLMRSTGNIISTNHRNFVPSPGQAQIISACRSPGCIADVPSADPDMFFKTDRIEATRWAVDGLCNLAPPTGIEPISSAEEALVLSIELRRHEC